MFTMEKTSYQGWPNCFRLYNSTVELVVTTDIGPRIIRYGFIGEPNLFYEDPQSLGQTGGDRWKLYGGHRLWHAPEAEPRTVIPDNAPITFEQHDGFIRVIQPVEALTAIQKEMDITLDTQTTRVTIVHRLRSQNVWPIELAPWSLSVMAPGGVAVIPLPPRGTHPENLTPTSSLVLWSYLDMTDPRWRWGREYILLRQDATLPAPQKIGGQNAEGWLAYANAGYLFVKTFTSESNAVYPDMHSAFEVFTNAAMLELETLGPVVQLQPGGFVEHIEQWYAFRNVPVPQDETAVRRDIRPLVNAAIGKMR